MRLYSVDVNGVNVVEVEMEGFDWMPVQPRLNRSWLRFVVGKALRSYFSTRCVVKA